MNIEQTYKRISTMLRDSFHVNEIKMEIVSPLALTGEAMKVSTVYAFEFIIDGSERYHTFAVETPEGFLFTRAKEGIRSYLTPLIRRKDFFYQLTGDIFNRNDIIGKFIESKINLVARSTMESTFDRHANSGTKSYNVCHGFVVSAYHKSSMSFNSAFELLVQATDEAEFKSYLGCFIDGKLDKIQDVSGKPCKIEDIFV